MSGISEESSPVIRQIASALRNHLTLTRSGVDKVEAFDPDEIPDGAGVVTVEFTKKEQPNPGLPDWYFYVSVVGMTFVSVDQDKKIIEDTFCDVLRSVASWTPATLGIEHLVGIQPVTNAAIRHDQNRRMFTADIKLIFVNLTF